MHTFAKICKVSLLQIFLIFHSLRVLAPSEPDIESVFSKLHLKFQRSQIWKQVLRGFIFNLLDV